MNIVGVDKLISLNSKTEKKKKKLIMNALSCLFLKIFLFSTEKQSCQPSLAAANGQATGWMGICFLDIRWNKHLLRSAGKMESREKEMLITG